MANTKTKIKAQSVETATLPGVVEANYVLTIGNENVNVYVITCTGKRISGSSNGLLGEISGQAVTENLTVKSNGKGWTIPRGSLAIIKGNITTQTFHWYGGKISTKKLLDVIGNYEAVKAYYTFFDSGVRMTSNISLTEKVFEWMINYAQDAKLRIGYVIAAIAAHDRATLSYAKKYMKKLKKDGATVTADVADIDKTLADLTEALTDDGEVVYSD